MALTTPVATSIYELLTNQEDARACRDIPEEACRSTPRNFVVLMLSAFLSKLGDAVANPKTILAWVLTSIEAPVYLLGFLVPIRESGSLIPQLVIAGFIRRLPIRKWVWVGGSLIQAIAMLGIGFVALRLTGTAAGLYILAFLVLFSLARGLCSVAAKDVLGKTVAKGLRGQLTGWSAGAAGCVTLAFGIALMLREGGADASRFYGFAIIGAACLWVLASVIYAQVREFPGETEGGRNAFASAWSSLSILREDRAFRRFVITRSLLLCSALTAPYFVALGQTRIGNGIEVLAVFVIASGLAELVSAPIWGRFADRSSRQVMMVAAMMTATIGLLVVAVDSGAGGIVSSAWFLPLAYFCLSIAHSGVRVSRKTYVVDLAGGNKRTVYVALSNSVIGMVLLFTGLVGLLASAISMTGVVAVLSLAGALGAWSAMRLPETD